MVGRLLRSGCCAASAVQAGATPTTARHATRATSTVPRLCMFIVTPRILQSYPLSSSATTDNITIAFVNRPPHRAPSPLIHNGGIHAQCFEHQQRDEACCRPHTSPRQPSCGPGVGQVVHREGVAVGAAHALITAPILACGTRDGIRGLALAAARIAARQRSAPKRALCSAAGATTRQATRPAHALPPRRHAPTPATKGVRSPCNPRR